MSDSTFHDTDVIAFTKNSPACPKCGGLTKRFYRHHSEFGDHGEVTHWLKIGEYLIVHCQLCHYEFPQHTKDAKP